MTYQEGTTPPPELENPENPWNISYLSHAIREKLDFVLSSQGEQFLTRLTSHQRTQILRASQVQPDPERLFARFGIRITDPNSAYHEAYYELYNDLQNIQKLGLDLGDLQPSRPGNRAETAEENPAKKLREEIDKGLWAAADFDKRRTAWLRAYTHPYVGGGETGRRKKPAFEFVDPSATSADEVEIDAGTIAAVRGIFMQVNQDPHDAPVQLSQRERDDYREKVDTNFASWYGHYLHHLSQLRRSWKKDKFVLTSEMQQHLRGILSTDKTLRLEGHLGNGKSELALRAGRIKNRQNKEAIRKEYEEQGYIIRSRRELLTDFKKTLDQHTPFTQAAFEAYCEKQAEEANVLTEEAILEPVVISGHKDLSPKLIEGGYTIGWETQTPEQLLQSFEDSKAKNGGQFTPDQAKIVTGLLANTKERLKIEAFLGQVLEAMKYGKVLIIDEYNAIPAARLILFNHLLTREAGDTVTPPLNGQPPITVRKGYQVLLTGNPDYVGTEKMNPAFLSRSKRIKVGYPQNTREPELITEDLPADLQGKVTNGLLSLEEATDEFMASWSEEQKTVYRRGGEIGVDNDGTTKEFYGTDNNELLEIAVAVSLPHSLSGSLPENFFSKVYQLCRCSRIIQDGFSGIPLESAYRGTGETDPKVLLEAAVPSLRALPGIIQQWAQDGFRYDLDVYLWRDFVQQYDDKELGYVYFVYHGLGGFFENQKPKETGGDADQPKPFFPDTSDTAILGSFQIPEGLEELENAPKAAPLKKFTRLDVLQKVYGPAPKMATEHEALAAPALELETQKTQLGDRIARLKTSIRAFKDKVRTGPDSVELGKVCKIEGDGSQQANWNLHSQFAA